MAFLQDLSFTYQRINMTLMVKFCTPLYQSGKFSIWENVFWALEIKPGDKPVFEAELDGVGDDASDVDDNISDGGRKNWLRHFPDFFVVAETRRSSVSCCYLNWDSIWKDSKLSDGHCFSRFFHYLNLTLSVHRWTRAVYCLNWE